MVHAAQLERVHEIWDELADFEAGRTDEALLHLLRSVSDMVGAGHAYWLGGVRVRRDARDILSGWRPAAVRYLNELPYDRQFYRSSMRRLESGLPDESTINHVRQAGRFRAVLLKDHVSPAFFESDDFERAYRARNVTDALFVVFPVNADAESYFCFMRLGRRRPFSVRDRDLAAAALRGIKWFHRQVMLSYGLLVAGRALTPTERRVLQLLLTPRSEKEIAAELELTLSTAHTHVMEIYRKFGVKSRAGLTALWLGRPAGQGRS